MTIREMTIRETSFREKTIRESNHPGNDRTIIIIIKTPQECRDEANALLVRVIQVWMFCPFCEAVSKRNVWKCEAMVMKIYDEVVC